jgi:hypothetical protein
MKRRRRMGGVRNTNQALQVVGTTAKDSWSVR